MSIKPSNYLRKRYQGIAPVKTVDSDVYEPINFKQSASEVQLPQIPSFEQETLRKLPIFQ